MRTILILLIIAFFMHPVITSAQITKEMQQEMQQDLSELKAEISELQKQIAEANKNDPESVPDLESELAHLNKQLEVMQNMMKGFSQMPANVIEQVNNQQNNDSPSRDSNRINSLPKKILSDAELAIFVKKIQGEVEKKISPIDKSNAIEVYNTLKTKYGTPVELSNIATTCWINGHQGIALYIMGKAILADSINSNILNNYAAFLTMAGGEHAALPILFNLNEKYPGNSTILNNIGQAWLGLGDISSAKKFLNMATAAYPNHAQANYSMCLIHKSEGKTQEAINCIKKSIRENYTTEKAALLNELGGNLEPEDIPRKYPLPKEPFGLHKFLPPQYPMTADDAKVNEAGWTIFHEQISRASDALRNQIESIKKVTDEFKKHMLEPQNQKIVVSVQSSPIYQETYAKFLMYESTNSLIRFENQQDSINKKAEEQVNVLRENYNKNIEHIRNKYSNCPGEGDPCYPQWCSETRQAYSNFLFGANKIWEITNQEILNIERRNIDEELYYVMYSSLTPDYFEEEKAKIKLNYLTTLGGLRHEPGVEQCLVPVSNKKPSIKNLPDFDDVNCSYKDEVFIPPFTTIKVECNRMITDFNISSEFGPKIKLSIEDNLVSGERTKGTLELGYEKGTHTGLGPFKAELKAEGAVGIEITQEGISKVYVKAGVGSELGGNVDEKILQGKGSPIGSSDVTVSWNVGHNGQAGSMNTTVSGQLMLNTINAEMTN